MQLFIGGKFVDAASGKTVGACPAVAAASGTTAVARCAAPLPPCLLCISCCWHECADQALVTPATVLGSASRHVLPGMLQAGVLAPRTGPLGDVARLLRTCSCCHASIAPNIEPCSLA